MNIPFIVNNWNDPASTERNEIVFENRKKKFGAYQLRKEYGETLLISLSISALILSSFIASYIFITRRGMKQDVYLMQEEILLGEPPSLDKSVPPPPPLVIPPPVRYTVIFTPPIVARDEEVQDLPPAADELQNVTASPFLGMDILLNHFQKKTPL